MISSYKKLQSNKRQLGDMDKLLYNLGLVALGIIVAAVLLYILTGFSVLNIRFYCVFNKLTHLPCPGCGGTRATRALVRGEFLKSLYDYPPLIYGVVVYAIFFIRCFLYKHFGIRKSKDGTVVVFIYIGVALIILQWIVKLVAQLKFGYYWFL